METTRNTLPVWTKAHRLPAPSQGMVRGPGALRASSRGPLGLGEEGGVDLCVLPAVLAGDDDVAGREQEDLRGDPLDLAVEALREAAGEVDEAAGIALAHLREVDDDRNALAERLGDRLGVAVLAGVDREDLVHFLYRCIPCG